jgi:hypothetical protein
MKTILSVNWALIAPVWYFGNGILQSATVLIQHKGITFLKFGGKEIQ